jgi:predicted alpha/beta superfamily hydrolase
MNHPFKSKILWAILFALCQAASLIAQNTSLKEISIASTILKKKVNLKVQTPEGYSKSKKRYAVLFVLNGDDKLVGEMATTVKSLNQENDIPEMIVVGLTNDEDNAKFLSCMEQELIPALSKKYRTTVARTLLSKDVSGSFALYALLTKPALFNGYISATHQWLKNGKDQYTGLAEKAFKTPDLYTGKKIFFAKLRGAYDDNDPKKTEKEMQVLSDLLVSKSGNRISTQYMAFDDWGEAIQPDFKECLLFVAAPEKLQKTPTAALEKHQLDNGKWVIRDKQKKVLFDIFLYDNGPDYPSEGLFRIVKDGKIGYADEKTNAIAIAPQFDCAYPFENGKAKVSNNCKTVKNGEYSIWTSDTWQYLDKKGKLSAKN